MERIWNMKFKTMHAKNLIAWQFHTSDTSLENIEYQMSKQWLYQEYDLFADNQHRSIIYGKGGLCWH